MAGDAGTGVKPPAMTMGRLLSVDGVQGAAVLAAARALAGERDLNRPGISRWDTSGIFGDVADVGADGDRPSARTVILLYAADLAFRLRWEIRPALAEGRDVIAAPYVETAIAFGRAAGLTDDWLRKVFSFAPPAEARYYVPAEKEPRGRTGLIEFASRWMFGVTKRPQRKRLEHSAEVHLHARRSTLTPYRRRRASSAMKPGRTRAKTRKVSTAASKSSRE